MGMKLEHGTWQIADPFDGDAGAFGRLYYVTSLEGDRALAKIVPNASKSHRELQISEAIKAARFANVIPVLDYGEHNDHWVIVMPIAQRSLAQHIDEWTNSVPFGEVLQILSDIAKALAEIDGRIVHRDLKPANILLHENIWKLADFGISRDSDASTAPETWKLSFTPAYASPEQWNHETATAATDVYAFGVIAYELIEGRRPFEGDALRDAHLDQAPPAMTSGTMRLRHLIQDCLSKDPNVRPHAKSLLARLEKAEIDPTRQGTSSLVQLTVELAEERSQEQARLASEREARSKRQRIANDAEAALRRVSVLIRSEIEEYAPDAVFDIVVGNASPIFRVRLGDAVLEFGRVELEDYWQGPFEVYASASIQVDFGDYKRPWNGRGHSLWFCDAVEEGIFAWYELAFVESAFKTPRPSIEPFDRRPFRVEEAFMNVTGTTEVAWPVTPVDTATPDEFIQRWLRWFADAARGTLSRVPETPAPRTWRT